MKKEKMFYGWWVVLGCVLITTTMVPSVMSMANKFLIPFTTEMGVSRGAFTFSNTILQIMGIFLAPFVTKKLAKGNIRRMQSISIIVFALAYASYGLVQNVYQHYAISFVIGISYLNAAIIPVSIIITNWFQKKRGLAMSIAMAGIGVGGFIFSPLVTMWLSHYGWRTTYFIFAAIILTVCLPVSLFLIKKQPSDKGLQPYGADEVDANQTKAVKQQLTISTKDSFTKSFFIILIIGMICNGIINSGALGQFPPALEELHGPAISASIISLYSLIGVGGKLLLGWINDKFGIKVSILFGCTAFALAFVCILFGQNIIFAYSMAIVFGLGNAIGTVIPPLVTSAIYGPEQYGDVYGYVSSATQIGLSIGSLAVAATFDMTGSYSSAWVVLAILSVVTMYSWLTAYRKSRQFSATPINE